VPRVVARLYDIRKAEIYKRLGIQTIAPTGGYQPDCRPASLFSLETVLSLGSGDVELVQAELPQLLVEKR